MQIRYHAVHSIAQTDRNFTLLQYCVLFPDCYCESLCLNFYLKQLEVRSLAVKFTVCNLLNLEVTC